MPSLDEQLTRALREAAPRPTTSGLDQHLARRRRARAVRRRVGTAALAVVVLAGTAAGFLTLSDAFEGDEDPLDPSPTIVPGPKANGPLVVVVPDGDQTSHLELNRLDGSVPEHLTEPGREYVVDPAGAPDGRRVALVAIDDDGRPAPLVVLDIDTREREVVAQDAFADPSWSPDGRSIVYEGLLGDEVGLVVVDLASGQRRFLASGADPSWSPDGTTIAFEVPSDRFPVRVERHSIFTVPATGGETTQIVDDGTSPSWSADGSSIAFTRPIGVWVADADGSDERLVVGWTRDEAQTISTSISYADPAWSPDGEAVVYTTFAARRSWIESIPADTVGFRMTDHQLAGSGPWRMSEGSVDATWLLATTPTPGTREAMSLEGVPFAVCRVTTVSGDFGDGLDTVWVFEEEHTPGSGCDRSEGFQHLAVGAGGRVEMMTGRVADVLNDDAWRVWAFAAPDLNEDGIDEIAIARQGGEPEARHLWLFRVAGGDVVPIGEDCGPACRPVPWNVEIGPIRHENGAVTDSGLTCGIPVDRQDSRDTLFAWQADTEDPLHIHLAEWRFDGTVLASIGESELLIQGTPGAFNPSGLDELCGSPTNRSVDFPLYLVEEVPSTVPPDLCNTSSMTGDVNGDGSTDLVTIGSVVGPDGCPSEGQRNRILTIDLDGDQRADVESDAIDCSTWCFPFATVDVSGDGKAEIFVNQGHTAPPASAVIAVYALADPDLVPVTFPDGTNRFPLVNSYLGYHGAYCLAQEDTFVTWRGETDGGGILKEVTFGYHRMDPRALRFVLLPYTLAPTTELPPPARRGYDGVFCGVEVETPG